MFCTDNGHTHTYSVMKVYSLSRKNNTNILIPKFDIKIYYQILYAISSNRLKFKGFNLEDILDLLILGYNVVLYSVAKCTYISIIVNKYQIKHACL